MSQNLRHRVFDHVASCLRSFATEYQNRFASLASYDATINRVLPLKVDFLATLTIAYYVTLDISTLIAGIFHRWTYTGVLFFLSFPIFWRDATFFWVLLPQTWRIIMVMRVSISERSRRLICRALFFTITSSFIGFGRGHIAWLWITRQHLRITSFGVWGLGRYCIGHKGDRFF